MNANLTRDAIFNRPVQLKREPLQVPEWGGTIFVRELTAGERDRLETQWETTSRVNFRARLVAAAACDEQGKNLFTEKDIPALGAQPITAIQRVFEAALGVNRFSKEDIEDLEKNSETTPSEGSSSA